MRIFINCIKICYYEKVKYEKYKGIIVCEINCFSFINLILVFKCYLVVCVYSRVYILKDNCRS